MRLDSFAAGTLLWPMGVWPMLRLAYGVVDGEGRASSGVQEADSAQPCVAQLTEQGVCVNALGTWAQGLVPEYSDYANTAYACAGLLRQGVFEQEQFQTRYQALSGSIRNVQGWFVATTGLRTEMPFAVQQERQGRLAERLAYYDQIADELDDLADVLQRPVTSTLAAQIHQPPGLLRAFVDNCPEVLDLSGIVAIYGAMGRTANEPFSAMGDLSGDGIPNIEVYQTVTSK